MDQDNDLIALNDLPQWFQQHVVDRSSSSGDSTDRTGYSSIRGAASNRSDFRFIVGENADSLFESVKQMAAQTGQPVIRVHLSAIVSKYIGETEKNLDKLFAQAETQGAILFFDEADAIFAKRSRVQDAHDRYANFEVDHLAKRLANEPGLKIYAIKSKDNIDPAFIRRLRAIPGSSRD